MKLFHLSDLHIGKQFYHYNLSEDQGEIFSQIIDYVKTEQPDTVLISGDIYDTAVPSAEAVALFDSFLTQLSEALNEKIVCIIAGNHDSAKRLEFASKLLENTRIYIAGMPPQQPEEYLKKVDIEDEYGTVHIYLLPFTKPGYVRKLADGEAETYDAAIRFLVEREEIETEDRNVILSHQFYTARNKEPITSESEMKMVGGLDHVDVSALEVFDYAALGHIHRPQKMGRETVRYCGTPLAYSISEADHEKAVLMVELGKKGEEIKLRSLPLKPLRRVVKLKGTLHELLEDTYLQYQEDFVSITLTDEIDPYYPKERLEEQYSHILEIRIENQRTRRILDLQEEEVEVLDPGQAFANFFAKMNGRVMTEEEQQLAARLIGTCMEGKE